jgi:hypothetical protein
MSSLGIWDHLTIAMCWQGQCSSNSGLKAEIVLLALIQAVVKVCGAQDRLGYVSMRPRPFDSGDSYPSDLFNYQGSSGPLPPPKHPATTGNASILSPQIHDTEVLIGLRAVPGFSSPRHRSYYSTVWRTPILTPYSYRSATIGSSLAARRAGM